MNKSPPSITKTVARLAINSKLKDNPFIANNPPTDAKLPPPAAKISDNKKMTRSPVTRSSGNSSSSNDRKKSSTVRGSVQKMDSPSSVSSSTRKTKTSSTSSSIKTTVGSSAKELPPSPPSSNPRSSRSSLRPLAKGTAATASGAVNKKMPRRPASTTQNPVAPEAAKPESTTEIKTTDGIEVHITKVLARPSSSSTTTTTNTSSARSTSSFSVGGCSTTSNSSNDGGDHDRDEAVAKDNNLLVETDIQEHGATISADTSKQCDQDSFDPIEMMHQLASAHAQLTAAKFSTAPSLQVAEDWQEKYECSLSSADEIRGRIFVETGIQRSIASVLKLSNTSDTHMLTELHTRTTHVDSLCHELILTLAHAYDSRTRYLQHLAGTLARAPPSRPNLDSSKTLTEREQALMREIVELRTCVLDESPSRREKEALIQVERLQNELMQWQHHVDQLKQREYNRIQDLTRTFQLREAEFELEIATLRQARDAYTELTAAKDKLEQALNAAHVREAEIDARHAAEMKQIQEAYQAREGELKEREIKPLQEALSEARQKTTELEEQLQRSAAETAQAREQQEREADLIGEMEEHVMRIHTLEAQVEALQAQIMRAEEEKAILEAEAELVAKNKDASEEQLKQALATTFCDSLQDMVDKLQMFATAQQEFTRREAAMMLQQASVEAELGSLLKEYDRLTRNIQESQIDRKHYESQIQGLMREKRALDREVTDYRVKDRIGMDGQTMTLRKEFRQLMATVKAEHEEAMEKEAEERRAVENELRDLKHDLEMKCWDMVSKGVQTSFVAYPGIV